MTERAEVIRRYFPHLSEDQASRFDAMLRLYPEWNSKINVVSRKDIDNLEVNHLLHSLAIARFLEFTPGSRVMDLGTGGGLPGLPLAVVMPEVDFTLIDRTGKKVKVAESIAAELGLENVKLLHGDAAEVKEKFDFVVSRAVMPQKDLLKIVRSLISSDQRNAVPNGLIALKGGNLQAELKGVEKRSTVVPVSQYFSEPYFEGKCVVYTECC